VIFLKASLWRERGQVSHPWDILIPRRKAIHHLLAFTLAPSRALALGIDVSALVLIQSYIYFFKSLGMLFLFVLFYLITLAFQQWESTNLHHFD
jgi:hypothetical protein